MSTGTTGSHRRLWPLPGTKRCQGAFGQQPKIVSTDRDHQTTVRKRNPMSESVSVGFTSAGGTLGSSAPLGCLSRAKTFA